jgi:glycosyltransferase involved in cell wall biosynthesis
MQLVSVIITTFQRTDFLVRAINSVLNSDYSNFEIVIVDDNGLGTNFQKQNLILLKDYLLLKNIFYFAMPLNSGACKARNQGVAIANGNIMMFLDDDDYYLSNKISKQVAILESGNYDACLCGMKRMDEKNIEIVSNQNYPIGENLKQFLINGNCFTSMIAIKKDSFLQINGFSHIDRFQDKFFMYKFFENNFNVFLLQEQLFVFQEHQNNRISFGNIDKISNAYETLLDFKKKHFYFFNKREQVLFINKNFLSQANIRSSGKISQRLLGMKYLIRSMLIFSNRKVFIKLLLSDKLVYFLKKFFNKVS